jgi:hypothetical protein
MASPSAASSCMDVTNLAPLPGCGCGGGGVGLARPMRYTCFGAAPAVGVVAFDRRKLWIGPPGSGAGDVEHRTRCVVFALSGGFHRPGEAGGGFGGVPRPRGVARAVRYSRAARPHTRRRRRPARPTDPGHDSRAAVDAVSLPKEGVASPTSSISLSTGWHWQARRRQVRAAHNQICDNNAAGRPGPERHRLPRLAGRMSPLRKDLWPLVAAGHAHISCDPRAERDVRISRRL